MAGEDPMGVAAEHERAAVEGNLERRDRVLKFADIAQLLCEPPLSLPDPRMWSGFIPPAVWREKHNDSPVRHQLIAICNRVVERERELAFGGRPPVAPALIDEKQLQRLHILLGEYGINDRDDKLMYLSAETDRKLASSKELTAEEAALIIDRLGKLIRSEKAKEAARANEAASEVDQRRPDGESDGDYRPHDHPRPAGRESVAGGWADDGPKYDPGYIIPGEEDLPPY